MSSDSIQMDTYPSRLDNPPKRKKYMYDQSDADDRTPDGGYKVKTYYPTWEQMKNFSEYMKHVHATNGNRPGLAKIVPPNGYKPRKAGYDDESLYEMEITSPIKQEVTGEGGLYQQLNLTEKKKMTVRKFKRLSEEKHPTPLHTDSEAEMDRLFWKNIFTNPSLYGADVPGTLYDEDEEHFNLTKLKTILDNIQDDYNVTIEGVNTTYLYFGMWKSSFCWHTEDMDLYSINYLHTGAPKSWYCIAPEYGKRFERLAASFFPHSFRNCRAFLRHKTTLISPQILKKYSVPFSRCTQHAGEFMITFPYSYHSGYNHGFNIAEATNFALEYWIDFGKWATRCECSEESVKISMQTFVKRYQADRYENWIRGRDVCKDPRDPKHVAAAPKPTEYDLYLRGAHDRMGDDVFEEEEEIEKKEIALQQNLSSNLKNKSKSSKKSPNRLKKGYQLYNEYLLAHESKQQTSNHMTLIPHYAPIPTEMKEINAPCKRLDSVIVGKEFKEKPDYVRILKKSKKNKSKREEKIWQKKEKRAQDRIILSQELLHFLPTTFTNEKKFNRCIAAQPPHCSICQILVPHPKDDEQIWGSKMSNETKQPSLDSQSNPDCQNNGNLSSLAVQSSNANTQAEDFKLPESSQVKLPRITFAMSEVGEKITSEGAASASEENNEPDGQHQEVKEGDSGYGDFLDMNLDKPSELLQCTVCMLAVHKLCYGVDKMPENRADWVCDRCIQANRSIISCALCPCRGGALKLIDNQWIHITCALTLTNVKHSDLIKRTDFKLPELVERNTCIYCANNSNLAKFVQGKTLSCLGHYDPLVGMQFKCENTFHPTCGHRNGALFDCYDYHLDPSLKHTLKATCHECLKSLNTIALNAEYDSDDQEESDLEPIRVGSAVIAESKKGLFLDGVIENHSKLTKYKIFYPALNMIESGVSERVIANSDKEFKLGDTVIVRSTTGDKEGKFVAKYVDDLEYVIRYDRTLQTERVSRRNIYLNVDQMSEKQVECYLRGSKSSENESPLKITES